MVDGVEKNAGDRALRTTHYAMAQAPMLRYLLQLRLRVPVFHSPLVRIGKFNYVQNVVKSEDVQLLVRTRGHRRYKKARRYMHTWHPTNTCRSNHNDQMRRQTEGLYSSSSSSTSWPRKSATRSSMPRREFLSLSPERVAVVSARFFSWSCTSLSGRASTVEHAWGTHLQDALLDAVRNTELVDVDGPLLAETMSTVKGLILQCWVPPWVDEDDIVAGRQVETYNASQTRYTNG